jgi:hypothetical protein
VVRGSFQKRVLDRKIEKVENRKQKNSFLQKIKMISAGKALAPRGGHFDLLEKRMSIH